jgi:lysophospholipase L1-like esterase
MLLEPKSKLLLIGDSITDCGRKFPVGETLNDGLGNGYVSLVDALLTATYPDLKVRVINMGIGGNTVLDLYERWERDVTALEPDWLSVMIGINDVWRQFDSFQTPDQVISIGKYTTTLEKLINISRPTLKGLILMTPYYLQPNRSDPMRVMMDAYGEVVYQLALKYDAKLVDTQAAMDLAMRDIPALSLATDRVHLNLAGHMILARVFLASIEYAW